MHAEHDGIKSYLLLVKFDFVVVVCILWRVDGAYGGSSSIDRK